MVIHHYFGQFLLLSATLGDVGFFVDDLTARTGRETVVIDAVTNGPPRGSGDFFPLTCDYRERTAAAGKFPGGFFKRETRPSEHEILVSRLVDRALRPLFPDDFRLADVMVRYAAAFQRNVPPV